MTTPENPTPPTAPATPAAPVAAAPKVKRVKKVVESEGLAAWSATWAAAPGAAVVDPRPEVARRLPDAHHADVVRVLASMTTLLMRNGRSAP